MVASWTGLELQRLPQPALEHAAIGPADTSLPAVFQDNSEFAVRNRLQSHDTVDVDDRGTVHTDKSRRIEACGELIERGAI